MKTDWTIKRNYGGGTGHLFYQKPQKEKAKERITFLVTEKQKKAIAAFCEKTELQLSEVIRLALSDYFEKVNFHFDDPTDNGNKDQLKMF
jgi:hypothetical protein